MSSHRTASRIALAVLILALPATALAQVPERSAPRSGTATGEASVSFAREAARSAGELLRSSSLAQRNSKDQRVRSFAGELVADYSEASEALLEICRHKDIDLPAASATATSMPEGAGTTFDRVYTLEMSQQLAKLQATLQQAIESTGIDPALASFARERLPLVRKQAAMADRLAKSQAAITR